MHTHAFLPFMKLADCILQSHLGRYVSGYHIHIVDDDIDEDSESLFEESVLCRYKKHPIRLIRSSPKRPIAEGVKTQLGHVDHFGIDFLSEPFPTIELFDTAQAIMAQTYQTAQFATQIEPCCHHIQVKRKIWTFVENYPPLEIALGPKIWSGYACHPRPAWPGT